MVLLLLEEYGPRSNWPAGLGTAARLLFALHEQLSSEGFLRALELGRRLDLPTVDDADERLAQVTLKAMQGSLNGEAFEVLMACAEEAHDVQRTAA
ncbi:hypothetical protein [Streptomyces sp. NRRL S-920]|uniref:hypothetical protein n=1 Tax=Streptomyces sp. NRRL S-920 TaxID=1463921 RepID=UPI0004C9692F|nr:hypothetical protein [Streptomyces sp. NRRL S-920]